MPQATKHHLSWLTLGLLGVITTALSAYAFTAEQSHLFAGGGSREARAEAFSSGSRHVGLATTTQRWFVIDCRNSTIYAFTNPVPDETRQAVAQSCLDGALDITASVPASSFAWFGAAHASLARQSWDDMNDYLGRSFATGAREGWIARYRAELAIDNYARLTPTNQTLFRQDLVLLAANMLAFSEFLATQYVNKVDLRPLITEVVETTPQASQWHFLAVVRRLTRQSAQGQS